MEATNYLPVAGLLVLAIVVTILLLRFMRSRHEANERRAEARVDATPSAPSAPATPKLSKEEQEYLDSSHISGPSVQGGRDALDTRADAWRSNKRK